MGDLALRVCREFEKQFLDLEAQVRTSLEDWRLMEFDEQCLGLMQGKIVSRVQDEAECRTALRAETCRVVEKLHELDGQLNIADGVERLQDWVCEVTVRSKSMPEMFTMQCQRD